MEEGGEAVDVLLRSFGLTVEERRCGDLIAADVFGDGFEGELRPGFAFEEGGGAFREVGVLGCLQI